MTRWLMLSTFVIAGQLLLAYVVGGLLRRAAEDSALPRTRPATRELAFPRLSPRRLSNRWRAVGR